MQRKETSMLTALIYVDDSGHTPYSNHSEDTDTAKGV